MRAEIIFTQITLFASISFTSFYHVITLTMRTEHWNEHHRSFLCFSLLSLFAKIQYNINQLKYPDVKHDRVSDLSCHRTQGIGLHPESGPFGPPLSLQGDIAGGAPWLNNMERAKKPQRLPT